MKRPQVSIAGLALTVAVIALGLAAIRGGSPAWAGAMASIMIFALIVALLGTILARGPRRVFWIGFATLGWSALLIGLVPWLHEHLGQHLLAPHLFELLDPMLHPNPDQATAFLGLRSMATTGGFTANWGTWDSLTPFQRVGAALEVLLWGYLGGWSARALAAGEDRPPAREAASA